MKFHTQLKANDIFKFSLAYTYSGLQLILAIAMVAVGVYMCVTGMGAADGQSNMIFGIVLIVLFVVVNPLMLYVKAKKQAIENPVYKMKTYYTLNEDGIFVELGEDKDKMLSYMKEHMKAARRTPKASDGQDISKYSKVPVKEENKEQDEKTEK